MLLKGFDPDKVFVTQFNSSRTLDTDSVRETFEKYFSKYDITVYKNLDEAVEMLATEVEKLNAYLEIPATLKE